MTGPAVASISSHATTSTSQKLTKVERRILVNNVQYFMLCYVLIWVVSNDNYKRSLPVLLSSWSVLLIDKNFLHISHGVCIICLRITITLKFERQVRAVSVLPSLVNVQKALTILIMCMPVFTYGE